MIQSKKMWRKPNVAVKANRIDLGINTSFHHGVFDSSQGYYVSLYNKSSGVISLVSGHSTGKSVLVKVIYGGSTLCDPQRPMIVFDMQGQDHRASANASRKGFIFKHRGQHRWGYEKRMENFTPAYLNYDNHYQDTEFVIPWDQLNEQEWRYLLGQFSDAKSWINQFIDIVTADKGKIRNLEQLLKDINLMLAVKAYQSDIVPRLREQELYSMRNVLRVIVRQNYLGERNDVRAIDFVRLMENYNKIVVLNFHLDESVQTKLYSGHIMRKIYSYYNRKYSLKMRSGNKDPQKGPIMVIEESNKLMPPKTMGGVGEAPSEKYIKEIITKGMKLGFKLIMIMQDAHDIDSSIRRNIQNDTVLVCNPTIPDLQAIEKRYGSEFGKVIRSLRRKPNEWGAKEWALIQDGEITTFYPTSSMMEFLRR